MTAETIKVRSTRGTSKRVNDYLEEQGLTLAEYDKMPIKKSEDPFHIEAKIRGNQFEWEFVPKSGIVTALTVKKKHGIPNVVHRVFIDKDRTLYGIPIGLDEKNELQYRRVYVTGSREFDLSKPIDREDFYTLIHSPALKDGVHDVNGKGLVVIDNPEADAEAAVHRFELTSEVMEIIRGYSDSDIANLGVLFKIAPTQKPILIKGALYEKARKDPKQFLRLYNSEDRKIRTVVEKAIHYRVLTEGQEGVLFGGSSIGLRIENAIDHLKDKPDLLSAIEQHIYEQTMGVSGSSVKPKAPVKPGGGRSLA